MAILETPQKQNSTDSKEAKLWHLYLHNDNHNSFWYVFRTIAEAMKIDPHALEQVVLIAHHNGKAHLKQGDPEELFEIQEKISSRGIDVELRQTLYA